MAGVTVFAVCVCVRACVRALARARTGVLEEHLLSSS